MFGTGLRAMRRLMATAFAVLIGMPAASSWGSDDPIEDIVQVLRDHGLIDEATEQKILVKNRNRAVSASDSKLLEGWEWSGDLRLRNEQFWYDDSFGAPAQDDRNRFRYRLRFGFKKKLNDVFTVGVRLASGVASNSTNVSFGDSSAFDAEDFGNDAVSIDQAYLKLDLPTPAGMDLKTSFVAGKFGNPLVWKNSKDLVIWDSDITPEGLYLTSTWKPSEQTTLFGTLAYYIIDEDSSTKDPKLIALQLGGSTALADEVEVGLRGSWYEWRSLDDDFITRTTAFGSLPGAYDVDDQQAQVGELTAYARVEASEVWPVLLYAQFLRNFNAEADPLGLAGQEDSGYGFGLEIGSSKKLFKAGFAYFHVEANATPALITDSDLFDSQTNREGFTAYFERVIFEKLTFKLTYFDGDEIEDDPIFAPAGIILGPPIRSRSDRRRLQTDISIEF